MSQKFDFHGWTTEDAINKIEEVIGDIRMSGKPDTVEFVTGHGTIKYEARDLLQKKYNIDIFSPLTSPSIVVTID